MSINELLILLDLNQDNKTKILNSVAPKMNLGYFFVDSEDGHCYLFDENGNIDDINKIKEIKESFVKKDVNKIIIPDSVKCIGKYAFYECKSLTSIKIPDSVKSIGDSAFYKCESVTSIKIPDSAKSIGYGAFADCENLTSIEISDSVENIEDCAFYGCKNLKSMTFENKTTDQVKSMENYPFGIKDVSIIKCIRINKI